jgi:hypothetical protein
VRELSETVGISRFALRALVRGGVLGSVPYGKSPSNVRLIPSEIFHFVEMLLTVATRGRGSAATRILLEDAVRRLAIRTPELLKPFIQAVMVKQIPLRVLSASPTRVEDVTLKLIDLQTWCLGLRG